MACACSEFSFQFLFFKFLLITYLLMRKLHFMQGHLLDTMSFMDPIPALKMKQWQLLVLLLLDALSVCRIPALASYMTGTRVWLPKVRY